MIDGAESQPELPNLFRSLLLPTAEPGTGHSRPVLPGHLRVVVDIQSRTLRKSLELTQSCSREKLSYLHPSKALTAVPCSLGQVKNTRAGKLSLVQGEEDLRGSSVFCILDCLLEVKERK